jgi:hypothetical protein
MPEETQVVSKQADEIINYYEPSLEKKGDFLRQQYCLLILR